MNVTEPGIPGGSNIADTENKDNVSTSTKRQGEGLVGALGPYSGEEEALPNAEEDLMGENVSYSKGKDINSKKNEQTEGNKETAVYVQPAKSNIVCRHWKKGFCSFEDECTFRHSEPTPEEMVENVADYSSVGLESVTMATGYSQSYTKAAAVPVQTEKSTAVCRHWMKGFCAMEDECKYSHSLEPPTDTKAAAVPVQTEKSTAVCRHWMKGFCAMEDECKYSHSLEPPTGYSGMYGEAWEASAGVEAAPVSSTDSFRFGNNPRSVHASNSQSGTDLYPGNGYPDTTSEGSLRSEPVFPESAPSSTDMPKRHRGKRGGKKRNRIGFLQSKPVIPQWGNTSASTSTIMPKEKRRKRGGRKVAKRKNRTASDQWSSEANYAVNGMKQGTYTGYSGMYGEAAPVSSTDNFVFGKKPQSVYYPSYSQSTSAENAQNVNASNPQSVYAENAQNVNASNLQSAYAENAQNVDASNLQSAYAENAQNVNASNLQSACAENEQSVYASNLQSVPDLHPGNGYPATTRKPVRIAMQPPPPGTEPVVLPAQPPSTLTEPIESPVSTCSKPAEPQLLPTTEHMDLLAPPGTDPVESPAPPGTESVELPGVAGPSTSMSSGVGKEKDSSSVNTVNKVGKPKGGLTEAIEAFLNCTKSPVRCLMDFAAMMRLTPTFHEVAVEMHSLTSKVAIECHIGENCYPLGTGKTKQGAIQNAAKFAFIKLLGLDEDDADVKKRMMMSADPNEQGPQSSSSKGHQSSVVGHQSSVVGQQSSSTKGHQSSVEGHQSSSNICVHFYNKGYCSFGDKCKFSHTITSESGVVAPEPLHPKRFTRMCRWWITRGKCPKGNKCQFRHSLEPPTEGVEGNGTVTSSVGGIETMVNKAATNSGYSATFGAAHGATSTVNQSNAALSSNTVSASDQLAELQKKIIGFAKKPTPKPLTEQRMTGQNEMVQDDREQTKVENVIDYNHGNEGLPPTGAKELSSYKNPTASPSFDQWQLRFMEYGSYNDPVQQNQQQMHSYNDPVQQNQQQMHGYNDPVQQQLHGYNDPVQQQLHGYNDPVQQNQQQMHGYNDPVQPNQQQMHGYNDPLQQNQQQMHGYNDPLQQNQQQMHGYNDPVQQNQQQMHGYNDPVQQNQQQLHGYNDPVQQNQQQMHGYNDPVQQNQQQLHGYNDPVQQNQQHMYSYNDPVQQNQQQMHSYNDPVQQNQQQMHSYNDLVQQNQQLIKRQSSSEQHDSIQSIRDRSPIRDKILDPEVKSSKTNSKSETEVFKQPFVPPPLGTRPSGSLSKTSVKRVRFSEDKSGMPPPTSSEPKLSIQVEHFKGTAKTSEKRVSGFSPAQAKMPPPKIKLPKFLLQAGSVSGMVKPDLSKPKKAKHSERHYKTSTELDYDDECFISMTPGPSTHLNKVPSIKHEISPNEPPNINEETRPDLSQYDTTYEQSHHDKEREALSLAFASGKTSKEFQGNIEQPRKPVLGQEMSNFIANFMRTVGTSKRGVQIVATKYHLPGNCVGLIPPKMTYEVWDLLKKPTQMRDETLQDVQRWLTVGIIPVIHQIDLLGAGAQGAKDVCRLTSDSLTVLAYVLMNMSIKRRLIMRNSLNKKYAVLCRTSNKVTDLLFGDNLANDLIEVKIGMYQVEASQEEDNDDMLSPNYKPVFFVGLAVPGPDVDTDVASMVSMACANEMDFKDLRDKYKIPSNCDTLIPAKINPEMWSLLSHSGLELDYRLQDVQLSIAEATVPLMWLLQSVHEKRYESCEALGMLTDALGLLCNAVSQMNNARMEAMLKTLPETVRNFSNWYWPGAGKVSEAQKKASKQKPKKQLKKKNLYK